MVTDDGVGGVGGVGGAGGGWGGGGGGVEKPAIPPEVAPKRETCPKPETEPQEDGRDELPGDPPQITPGIDDVAEGGS